MTTTFKYYFLTGLAFSFMNVNHVVGQNSDTMKNSQTTNTTTKVWAQDEADVKATVEKFLVAAGNYAHNTIAGMTRAHANIGIARFRNGKWSTQTIPVSDFMESLKTGKNNPTLNL